MQEDFHLLMCRRIQNNFLSWVKLKTLSHITLNWVSWLFEGKCNTYQEQYNSGQIVQFRGINIYNNNQTFHDITVYNYIA